MSEPNQVKRKKVQMVHEGASAMLCHVCCAVCVCGRREAWLMLSVSFRGSC